MFKRAYNRYKRKRPAKKTTRRRRYTRKAVIPRAPRFNNYAPLGKTHSVNFRYTETILINPVAGYAGDYVFSANGVYDPNITGTGHQPYGFDQMMAMFNHCYVIGSKITVRMVSNQSIPAWLGVALRPNATSLSGTLTDVLIEQPGLSKKLVPLTGDRTTTISRGFSAYKFFSKNRKSLIGDETYTNTNAANPPEQAYYHVLLMPYNSSDDLTSNVICVSIDYHCVFAEPAILSQS